MDKVIKIVGILFMITGLFVDNWRLSMIGVLLASI